MGDGGSRMGDWGWEIDGFVGTRRALSAPRREHSSSRPLSFVLRPLSFVLCL